jgi:hypothetical protein
MSNERKINRVALAICYAAGQEHNPDHCSVCEDFNTPDKGPNPNRCQLIQQFRREAIAALRAVKGI